MKVIKIGKDTLLVNGEEVENLHSYNVDINHNGLSGTKINVEINQDCGVGGLETHKYPVEKLFIKDGCLEWGKKDEDGCLEWEKKDEAWGPMIARIKDENKNKSKEIERLKKLVEAWKDAEAGWKEQEAIFETRIKFLNKRLTNINQELNQEPCQQNKKKVEK